MNRDQFIRSRQKDWKRFEVLLEQADKMRLNKMSGSELSELSSLYRGLCYDLSLVQSRDWGSGMSRYLNNLVARGHNSLYRSRPGSLKAIVEFLFAEFPYLLRANIWYFLVALFLSVVPGTVCGILVAHQPALASRVIPESAQAEMEMMYSESLASEYEDEERAAMRKDAMSLMAGFYVRNNVGIAFKCFGLGITLGIGTVVVLIFNSIYIGTITGYLIGRGHSGNFFEFVISHGSFELTAIVISGTAGLMLGHAIVHPGQLRRWDSLKSRGLDAIKIALGAGAMLLVAALIEGYWSPSPVPREIKMFVGTLLWVLVIVYLTLGGRNWSPQTRLGSRGES